MGMVFDIRSFCVDDGEGVRTTVFLKGCPLRCLWCHNPEGQSSAPEISFVKARCIGCGRCRQVCPSPDQCTGCGACATVCIGARRLVGQELTAQEVLARVLKDQALHGGLTLTGGEPLFQPDFTLQIARLAKQSGLDVAIETSGCGSHDALTQLIPYVDCFLFDIKECDEQRHRADTGVSLLPILQSLDLLASHQAKIVLRCPIIPGFNDRAEHFAFIARLANRYPCVQRVDVLPYHSMGKGKYQRLGRAYTMPDIAEPSRAMVDGWVASIASQADMLVLNGNN